MPRRRTFPVVKIVYRRLDSDGIPESIQEAAVGDFLHGLVIKRRL